MNPFDTNEEDMGFIQYANENPEKIRYLRYIGKICIDDNAPPVKFIDPRIKDDSNDTI